MDRAEDDGLQLLIRLRVGGVDEHFRDIVAQLGEQRAQALAEELTMSVSVIAATKNLGMVSYLREEYTEALSRFQRALDMAIEDKTVDAQAEIYRLMGDTYLDIGDCRIDD